MKNPCTSLLSVLRPRPVSVQEAFNNDVLASARKVMLALGERDLTKNEVEYFKTGAHRASVTEGAPDQVAGRLVLRLLKRQYF